MFFWEGVCVVSNQCCRRDLAALERPGRLRTGRARRPPSVCFPPSPATVSYASETSHFGSSSPTLHHTPSQNTHKYVYLFAWDVLLPTNLNYTTQLCKFIHFKLSKQLCHSVSQCQLYLNSPQEISSEYLSKRVSNTVTSGNLPFTSNTVRTLRSRYISSHNEGFCLSRVFPVGCGRWWCHSETELWLNPVRSVIKGAEPTDWVECHTQHSLRPQTYTFCPACTFWRDEESVDFVLLDSFANACQMCLHQSTSIFINSAELVLIWEKCDYITAPQSIKSHIQYCSKVWGFYVLERSFLCLLGMHLL